MIKNEKKEDVKYLSLIRKAKTGIYGNLLVRQAFVDCCKEFQFIRAFDTINFNNKMNRLGLIHLVLDEDYNFTEILESDIIEPIINRSNNVFGIIGKTGTGKSELGMTISLISKRANRLFLNRDVELFLCFTWEDFHASLKLLKKGDVVLKDETPRTVGKGSRVQKWAIENILHAIRKMENTFIFIDPLDIKLDLCDLYLESAGMNFRTRTNRFMLLNEKKEYFGHVYVKLHENEQFRSWYETQKDKFIDGIKEIGGKVEIEEEKETDPEDSDNELYDLIDSEELDYIRSKEIEEVYIQAYLTNLRYKKVHNKNISYRKLGSMFDKSHMAIYENFKKIKECYNEFKLQ